MACAAKVIHMDEHRTPGPQLEDGHVRIANELYDAILEKISSFRHLKVALAIIRKTYGYSKKEDDITISQLAEITGIHRNNVGAALRELEEARIINPVRSGRHGLIIGLNKHHEEWVSDEVKPRGPGRKPLKLIAQETGNQNVACEQSKQLPTTINLIETGNQNVAHNNQPQKTTPIDNSNRNGAQDAPAKPDAFDAAAMIGVLPGLSDAVASDYLKFRRSIKKPLNATAWGAIAKQVVLSGWVPDDAIAEAMAAGWQGVNAEWLNNRKPKAAQSHQGRMPTQDSFSSKDYGQGGLL